MARTTSAVAYRTIASSGLLSKRRREAYIALYQGGPATASELSRKCGIERHALQKRLSELVQFGVARETCTRTCLITGYQVLEFDVTADLPRGGLTRPPSKLQVARARVHDLEGEVATLRYQLFELRRELGALRPKRTPVA